jgi:hypothetical protein
MVAIANIGYMRKNEKVRFLQKRSNVSFHRVMAVRCNPLHKAAKTGIPNTTIMTTGVRVYVNTVVFHETPYHRHERLGSFKNSNLTVPRTQLIHAKKVAGHCTL